MDLCLEGKQYWVTNVDNDKGGEKPGHYFAIFYSYIYIFYPSLTKLKNIKKSQIWEVRKKGIVI